jgi:ATP-dependent RNA helicase DDX27
MKFVKRRTRGKVDDKIAKVISNRKNREMLASEDEDEDPSKSKRDDEEIDLSDDELQHDNIKVKKKKKGKKHKQFDVIDENAAENEKMEFEECGDNDGTVNSFYQMNLSRPLMKSIGVLGYIYPTPIQASTIPVALLGRDICGCAATGTGKTAAYMLPTLERLLYKPLSSDAVTRVLVLVPTRVMLFDT